MSIVGDDLTFASFQEKEQAPAPQSTPLPPVNLPAFPRPSLSPAQSKVQQKRAVADPGERRGLDLNTPVSPTRQDSSRVYGNMASYSGADSLEDDVARARQERTARRNQSVDLTAKSAVAADPGSARANIIALAQNGRGPTSTGGGPASLASFMGGGVKPPRLHRVGTGPTEQEQEETARLEQEMAATRARWAGRQPESANSAPPANGFSLASLIKGSVPGKTTSEPVSAPGSATTASTPVTIESNHEGAEASDVFTASPVDDFKGKLPSVAGDAATITKSPTLEEPSRLTKSASAPVPLGITPSLNGSTARSLASVFGSSAKGPRLYSPSAQHEDTADEGPAHARRGVTGAFALPGMVQRQHSTEKAVSQPESQIERSSPSKRNSVVERWGRDLPNSSGSSSPSPMASPSMGGSPWTAKDQDASAPSSISRTASSGPALTHANLGRARPPKSAPRTSVNQSGAGASSESTKSAPEAMNPAASESSTEAHQSAKPSVLDRWTAPPIGVKKVSSPAAENMTEGASERSHPRGVALPGLASARSASPPSSSTPTSPQKNDAARSATLPVAPGSPSSVRNLVASWGKPPASPTFVNKAIKESYGVKVDSPGSREPPSSPSKLRNYESQSHVATRPQAASSPAPSPSSDAPAVRAAASSTHSLAPVVEPSKLKPKAFAAATYESTPTLSTSVDSYAEKVAVQITELVTSRPATQRQQTETLDLEVYSLDANGDQLLDHNHVVYAEEGLAIVHRFSVGSIEQVKLFVWKGEEYRERPGAQTVIDSLSTRLGVAPIAVAQRHEPRELAEAFGDQFTICAGSREHFSHLETSIYSVRSADGVVFVEEQPLSSNSICSGYSVVFSLVGEVYAWYGRGSNMLEREACLEFAGSLADGRQVTELEEGAETAYFWHGLDGLDYGSAHYWRFRATHPHSVSVIIVDSKSDEPARKEVSSEVSEHKITFIDGGFEHFVIVPEGARSRTDDISIALLASEQLAGQWKHLSLPYKPPCHVLVFPTLIPRDLPHLARGLDLWKLNTTAPVKFNLLTATEAREQLL